MKRSLGAKTLVDPTPDIAKLLPLVFSPSNRAYYGVGPSLGHAFAVGREI